MVQIIDREWEIAKEYICEVVMREGLISLDWNDFKHFALRHRPALAVKVDEPLPIGEQTEKALAEMKKHIGRMTSIIVAVTYKRGDDIMMDEIGGLNDCLASLAEDDVEIKWGIQAVDEQPNRRSVTVFAFEKL